MLIVKLFKNYVVKDIIKNMHNMISTDIDKAEEYKEITTEILLPNNESLTVKWFNIHINGEFQLTLSVGIQRCIPSEESDDSIRSYYRDIINQDATMIKSIRETFLANRQEDLTC